MCYFCQKNINEIDFKKTEVLSRFVSSLYKIKSKEKSGLCSKHQRMIAKAIKRARQLGIIPYMPRV